MLNIINYICVNLKFSFHSSSIKWCRVTSADCYRHRNGNFLLLDSYKHHYKALCVCRLLIRTEIDNIKSAFLIQRKGGWLVYSVYLCSVCKDAHQPDYFIQCLCKHYIQIHPSELFQRNHNKQRNYKWHFLTKILRTVVSARFWI